MAWTRICLALLITSTASAGAQVATREWTLCSGQHCGRLSLHTVRRAGGGTGIAVGIANLQGLTGAFPSLLRHVSFGFPPGPGGHYVGDSRGWYDGRWTDDVWEVSGTPSGLNIRAPHPEETSRLGEVREFSEQRLVGDGPNLDDGWWGSLRLETWLDSLQDTVTTTRIRGIAGVTVPRSVSRFRTEDVLASRAGYESRDVCIEHGFSGCTRFRTDYKPRNYWEYIATQRNEQSWFAIPTAQTSEGESVWFRFETANLYDADAATYAFMEGIELRADGPASFSCNTFAGNCTGGEGPPGVVPEPGTLTLFGAGLVALSRAVRRRRSQDAKTAA